ncbi:YczE/YyaS/YitT family protein [Enterococcus sp.]|uniref:YczE/YyaS/YitT family protein n=1 Tax=Enterococcus sp. TaxID=35783 RepID=UPI0029074E18|nr:DUF6198 family protein [Enterococcus sp.]MDU5336749.1 DUF6198 family protein [Enterococcus sp.]
MMKNKKQLIMLIVGVLIISLGTVLCKKTSLGIDPFNAFCVGISETISLNLGTTTLLINAALISVILLTGRSFIGIGTVLTMVSIGYFISFFDRILPNVSFDLFAIPNILLFVVGMLIMCFGVSLYIESHLGMVPYDCFSFIVSKRFGGKTFVYRIMLDSLTSLIAFIFGGPISVGTIILAGGLGPLIDFFRELIQKYRGLEGNRNLEKVD